MGAASNFKKRIEDQSSGITDLPGVQHLGDLTPFQGQVLDAAQRKEAEKQEEMREEARNGGGRKPNARAGGNRSPGGAGSKMEQEETVRYVNKELNPEHEAHKSN